MSRTGYGAGGGVLLSVDEPSHMGMASSIGRRSRSGTTSANDRGNALMPSSGRLNRSRRSAGRVHLNLEDDQVLVGGDTHTDRALERRSSDSFALRGSPRAPSVVLLMGREDVPDLRL